MQALKLQSPPRRTIAARRASNPGAFVFAAGVLDKTDIEQATALALGRQSSQTSVHTSGNYKALKWFQVELSPDIAFCAKILATLGVTDPELLVFYYLEPGARIHPHRDLTGAGLNNRLRFHVPVITNPDVKFIVSGKRVSMTPGDLWCLDTSYEHSVANDGDQARVHIVIECYVGEHIRSRLPENANSLPHRLFYAAFLGVAFAKALAINSVKDRDKFRAQMQMVAKFVGWRFLGSRKPS